MKRLISFFISILLVTAIGMPVFAQNSIGNSDQILKQMAKIRQSTNWNDPAAAKKANDEIHQLAKQISGSNSLSSQYNDRKTASKDTAKSVNFELKTNVTKENTVAIADRFYKRSYKTLIGMSKIQFDQDLKDAQKAKFDLKIVQNLTSTGASLITFGNDHNLACVYLTAAVKALPTDTLSINNFGAYLRIIDSVEVSVPVLLYANKLYSKSPVILTQLGNSFFELHDLIKAEYYYKEALKYDPDFSQAHTSLCDLFISQKRIREAILELFAGVKGMGFSYSSASKSYAQIKDANKASGKGDDQSGIPDDMSSHITPNNDYVPNENFSRVRMPNFPYCPTAESWLEGGGYTNAVMSYSKFHAELMDFVRRFDDIHNHKPNLSQGAILLDYGKERFMIETINEYYSNKSEKAYKKYAKSIDQIRQRVNDAQELYIKNLEQYNNELVNCMQSCDTTKKHCMEECLRIFCLKECPNANKFNEVPRNAYNDCQIEFSALVKEQKRILTDLYYATDPWLDLIYGLYWSTIYQFETKSVAMGIVGNCYIAYPLMLGYFAHNGCGTDCLIYANRFVGTAEEVNKKDPKGKECNKDSKRQISAFICELSWDCESVELGCTEEGLSGSIKRNFVRKTTSVFLGAGIDVGAPGMTATVKGGGEITLGDDGKIDIGLKGSVSGTTPTPLEKGKPIGVEHQFTLTVLTGLNIEKTKIYGPHN